MSNFTPQEIEEFLQEFFDVVGARQYVGARYVPIFGRAGEDTIEWDDLAPYEPLTVVMHEGVSYVSRRYVPTGIQITDTAYWAETYRFNAQVEQYRQQVMGFSEDIAEAKGLAELVAGMLPTGAFSSDATVEDAIAQVENELTVGLTSLGQMIDSLIIESGTSDAETIAARTDAKTGRTYSTLANRLLTESWTYVRDIAASDDMDNLTDLGFYYVGDGIANIGHFPLASSEIGFVLVFGKSVINTANTNTPAQLYVSCRDIPQLYMRQASGAGPTWSAWKRIANDSLYLGATVNAQYDADTLLQSGYWFVNNSSDPSSYAHYPCETGVMFVLPQIGGSQAYQVTLDATTSDIWYRRRAGATPTWGSWISLKSVMTTATILALYLGSTYESRLYDADDLQTTGYCWVNHADADPTLYSHYVSNTGVLMVLNRPNNVQCYQVCIDVPTQNVYFRRRGGAPAAWSAWYPIYREPDPPVITPQLPDRLESLTANPALTAGFSGVTMRVMTYNVCQYDNDTTTDISDDQLFALRSLLMDANCDIMGWQESTAYINDNTTNDKRASEWVFYGAFNYNYINNNESLHSRTYSLRDAANVALTDGGRHYSHANIQVNGKVVSLYSVHAYPQATPEAKAIREANLREFAGILDADTADYKIAFGDFNIREDETALFKTIFTDYDMVNGGYLGWYATTGRYAPTYGTEWPNDNILLSKNIGIKSVHLYKDWYTLLCSDHLPLVAEIVLIGA